LDSVDDRDAAREPVGQHTAERVTCARGVDHLHGGGGNVREASAASRAVHGGALAAQRDDEVASEVELPCARVDLVQGDGQVRAQELGQLRAVRHQHVDLSQQGVQ